MRVDRRFQELANIDLPIVLAPMAGPVTSVMTIAVAEAGGLGSLPCALLSADQIRTELGIIRQQTSKPVNLNFFCHTPPQPNKSHLGAWQNRLESYYVELGLDPKAPAPVSNRTPFDSDMCELVEEFRPEIVSFHFGLPEDALLSRVKATGAKVMSTATSVAEARWLEERGCDAIIAQGAEAGGHSGLFLTDDINTLTGTFALVPLIVDAVSVPVIAAGGIADARGIVAALALGASAVQIGTAYLLCPEAKVSPVHRQALREAEDGATALTNVFTGRPARGIVNRIMREVGPMSDIAPEFPLAGGALAPLRAQSEPAGSQDFMSLWSGQAGRLAVELPTGELTRRLGAEMQSKLDSV